MGVADYVGAFARLLSDAATWRAHVHASRPGGRSPGEPAVNAALQRANGALAADAHRPMDFVDEQGGRGFVS